MAERTDRDVPELRFKGFRGKWDEARLGQISASYSGGTPSVAIRAYYGGEIPFIRSGEINSATTELQISQMGLKNSSAKLVSEGDILYALYGATSGEVGVSQITGAINQAILAIKPVGEHSTHFLAKWLRRQKAWIISTYLQGGQGNLSGQIIKSLSLFYPSPPEQTQIGGYFEELDRMIELHQRKHEKLVTLKQAMLQKMFPQDGATTPQIRFKGFKGDWGMEKLGNISLLLTGYPFEGKKFVSKGILLVRGMNVKRGYLDSSKGISEYWPSIDGFEDFLLQEDDIVIQMDGALIGKSYAKIKKGDLPALLVQRVTRLRCQTIDCDFIYQYIQRDFLNYIRSTKTETAVPHLSLDDIRKFSVALPHEAEQQKIGTYFRNLDKLISKHSTQLKKLKNLKSACLEKMFV